MKAIVALISVLTLVACQSPPLEIVEELPAALIVTVNPPNQAQPFNVFVGRSITPGAPVTQNTYVVVYRNVNTGTCVWMQGLGDTGGYLNSIEVHGTGYGDSFETASSNTSTYFSCYEQPNWHTYQIGPMNAGAGYHGRMVTMYGGGGGEFMTCNGAGTPIVCYGGDGDDYLETVLGDAMLFGDEGNDRLIGWANDNSHAGMSGDAGDDCLSYVAGRPSVYDCGAGTGDVSHGVWGNNGCEAYTSACP